MINKKPLLSVMLIFLLVSYNNLKADSDQLSTNKISRKNPKQFFITQEKSKTNKHASKDNGDCGPTSLAMAAKCWNMMPIGCNGTPEGAERLVTEIRKRMTGRVNHKQGTDAQELVKGAKSLGMQATIIKNLNIKDLKNVLKSNHMVIAGGCGPLPCCEKRAFMDEPNKKDLSRNPTGHWVLVISENQQEIFLVNDPVSNKKTLRLNKVEMARFLHPPGNEGVLLEHKS
jgi:hypothetical protein